MALGQEVPDTIKFAIPERLPSIRKTDLPMLAV